MDSQEKYTIDLSKIFLILKSNLLLLISVTVACAVVSYIVSAFLIKPTYSANATMYVNNSKNQSQTQVITQADLNAASNLVDTYSVVLKSHSILGQVIKELNLDMTYEQMEKKVNISAVNDTQIMKITVTDYSPELAVQIAKKICDLAPQAIIDTMNSGSVEIVDKPWSSGKPVSPNVRNNVIIAGLVGFLVCYGILIIADLLNNKFKSVKDVKDVLDLPIVGIIPLEKVEYVNSKKGK